VTDQAKVAMPKMVLTDILAELDEEGASPKLAEESRGQTQCKDAASELRQTDLK